MAFLESLKSYFTAVSAFCHTRMEKSVLDGFTWGAETTDVFLDAMRGKGWTIEDRGIKHAIMNTGSVEGIYKDSRLYRDYSAQNEAGAQKGSLQWERDACDVLGLTRNAVGEPSLLQPSAFYPR